MILAVDWAFAVKVGGVGFGMVFAVLILLAVILWLSGMIFKKMESGKDEKESGESKKGA